MSSNVRWSLAGARTPDESVLGCVVCGSAGAPALVLLKVSPSHRNDLVHRLCLPCVGKAVQDATGWKVMNAWSQWLAVSVHSQGIRAEKSSVALVPPVQITEGKKRAW